MAFAYGENPPFSAEYSSVPNQNLTCFCFLLQNFHPADSTHFSNTTWALMSWKQPHSRCLRPRFGQRLRVVDGIALTQLLLPGRQPWKQQFRYLISLFQMGVARQNEGIRA